MAATTPRDFHDGKMNAGVRRTWHTRTTAVLWAAQHVIVWYIVRPFVAAGYIRLRPVGPQKGKM